MRYEIYVEFKDTSIVTMEIDAPNVIAAFARIDRYLNDIHHICTMYDATVLTIQEDQK